MASIAMDLAEIRDFVRNHLDVDSEELPSAILDRFIIDASDRIERASVALGGHWTFRQVTYPFNVVNGTQSYDMDVYTGLAGTGEGQTPLAFLEEVRGSNWSLLPEDHRAMRARYTLTNPSSGTPRWFTTWGRKLFLWPSPTESETYDASGYRKGIDWVSANAAPDFPAEFHELIAVWALNRSYLHQDDLELAAFFREEFALTLKERALPYIMGNSVQPFTINAMASSRQLTTNPSGLVYPFQH